MKARKYRYGNEELYGSHYMCKPGEWTTPQVGGNRWPNLVKERRLQYESMVRELTRKPSAFDVYTAFPEECAKYAPKRIKYIQKTLSPLLDIAKKIRNDYSKPSFYRWFWVEVLKKIYMPKDLVEQLAFYQLIQNMGTKKSNGGVTREQIFSAKQARIEDLYDGWVKKRGGYHGFTACCPFGTHEDRFPSFSVKNNRFKCFSCHEHGDSIEFFMKITGQDFLSTVKRLSQGGV